MIKKKILIPVGALLICMGVGAIGGIALNSQKAEGEHIASSLFDMHGVKAKTASSAGFNEHYTDARKGITFYTYDSGTRVDYKSVLTGKTTFDFKSSTLDSTSPNLFHYSMVITDVDTKDSFIFHIEDDGLSNTYYVEKNGEKAGFSSQESSSWKGHGFTKLYNLNEKYTVVDYPIAAESNKITFDPSTVSISVSYSRYTVKVWDFTSSYIDGKAQIAYISPMKNYQISFVMDQVKNGTKGELTVYSIGDVDFAESFLADDNSAIVADFSTKALVNEPYRLPTPINANPDEVRVRIFDSGNQIVDQPLNSYVSFTPTASKSYYVVYYTNENSGWYKLDAVNAPINNFVFEPEFNDESVGYNAKFYVPTCKIQSNLFEDDVDAVVTISYKGGAVLEGYNKVRPGFVFTFSEMPDGATLSYTFTYSLLTDNPNFNYTKSFDKKVIKINQTIDIEEYDELYALNSTLKIHPAIVYTNGKTYSPTSVVKYPSGETSELSEIILDEPGHYEVTYTSKAGEFVKKFSVVQDVNSLFTASYAEGRYGSAYGNDDYKGYVTTFHNKGKVLYNKKVDISKSTKDDILIGIKAEPTIIGSADLTTLIVKVTDANNPSNYLNLRLRQGNDNMSTGTFIRCAAYNQMYAGLYWNPWGDIPEHIENTAAHEMGGFAHNHDFTDTYGFYKTFETSIVRLYYDYTTKTIYTDWDNHANNLYKDHPAGQISRTPILDFDDTTQVDKIWNGFSTGEVYISVEAYGISGTGASAVITDIYGSNLKEQMIKDVDGPEIDVDQFGHDYVPHAITGTPYKLLPYVATDIGSGISSVDVKVFNSSLEEMTVTTIDDDLYFTPNADGDYQVVYTAIDNFDNKTTKAVTVNSINSTSYEPLVVSVGSHVDQAYLGETVNLPDATVTGGVGYETVEKVVYYGSIGGTIVDSFATYFIPTATGTYVVEYTAKDYLGHVATDSFSVTIIRNEKPIPLFDTTNGELPLKFINGVPYKFAKYEALYYTSSSSGSLVTLTANVEVTDAAGTKTIDDSGIYTPTYTSECKTSTVKISFTYDSNKTLDFTYVIDMVASNKGSGFMCKYFTSENLSFEAWDDRTDVEVLDDETSTASATFIRPINEKIYSLEIMGCYDDDYVQQSLPRRNNFNHVLVRLYDSKDRSVYVDIELDVRYNAVRPDVYDGLYARINGGEYKKIEGSLHSNVPSVNNVALNYDAETFTLTDAIGSIIGTIDKTALGDDFNGFPSKEIITSISLTDIHGPSCFCVVSIGGQRINDSSADKFAPKLFVDGNYYGSFDYNDEVVFPAAEAYDVLSYCSGATLTVQTDDGRFVTDENGVTLNEADASIDHVYKVDHYGTINITYTAVDSAGNKTGVKKTIEVVDKEKPVIKLNFNIGDTVSKGTTFNLMNYTVSDNFDDPKDIIVNIYLAKPDNITDALIYTNAAGEVIKAKGFNGSYTFSSVGHYRLMYMAFDTNGNANVLYFDVNVK